MSRNVGHFLSRPRALAQCRTFTQTTPAAVASCRGHSTDSEEAQTRLRSREEAKHLLQVADLKALRETTAQCDQLAHNIHQIKEHLSLIPNTVQLNPTIPPYTLGYQRQKIQETQSEPADKALADIERVKLHLRDLYYLPYKDKDPKNALVEFEKEFEGQSREQKEETLKNWSYEKEARRARGKANVRALYDAVVAQAEQNKRVKGLEKVKNPFESGDSDEARVGEGKTESKGEASKSKSLGTSRRSKEAKASQPSAPPVPALSALQAQLAATINAEKD
ncbi:hypothetical protein LTR37_010068 [Vermiconidia calcicola]|uniref:Uncharacterized protein n=1 Tax=Vermiconidia calcicola TaxID=1690605 RepID=A0ACC3N600_9PEZI|nr:hypothetical protein LTR37_010068 [Vermiconidia calcicola]